MSAQGSETLGKKCEKKLFATLKGLRGFAVNRRWRNSYSFPRVAKAQPWAGIGERFQRYSFRPWAGIGERFQRLFIFCSFSQIC